MNLYADNGYRARLMRRIETMSKAYGFRRGYDVGYHDGRKNGIEEARAEIEAAERTYNVLAIVALLIVGFLIGATVV